MSNNIEKVAVGLSGGVDSSVAAAILKKSGYDVIGISMAVFDDSIDLEEGQGHACFDPKEEEEMKIAEEVCEQLSIPFYKLDLSGAFQEHVLDYFKKEYLSGRTPNPCVVCNNMMKFGYLINEALDSGIDFDYFATGHYARKTQEKGEYRILKPSDKSKDQTYFLYAIDKNIVRKLKFPLGNKSKVEVRKLAEEFDLPTSEVDESQDFVSGDYAQIFDEDEMESGKIINTQGKVLGKHDGIVNYTVGQRRGLGISHHSPLYVKEIDANNNRIVVTEDKEKLYSAGLIAENVNLLTNRLNEEENLKIKIRKNSEEVPGRVKFKTDRIKVDFKNPQRAVTPGQSAVLYRGEQLLGGGVITKAISS